MNKKKRNSPKDRKGKLQTSPIDLLLVDEGEQYPIGRFTMQMVLDEFTQLPLGWRIYSTPSGANPPTIDSDSPAN